MAPGIERDGARAREKRRGGKTLTSQRAGRRSRHKGRSIGQAQAQDRQHRTHGFRGLLPQQRRRTSGGRAMGDLAALCGVVMMGGCERHTQRYLVTEQEGRKRAVCAVWRACGKSVRSLAKALEERRQTR